MKLSGHALYRSYIRPGKQKGQWEAITKYADKHTIANVAVFVTLLKPNASELGAMQSLVKKAALQNHVIVFIISVQ